MTAFAALLLLAAATAPRPVRLVVEAEDFETRRGWAIVPYRQNYYASTFAISFLSRMACLGAPEQLAEEAVASLEVLVPVAGDYRVFARYEQPLGFAAQFRLEIEQAGRSSRRFFGRAEDPKIWAFGGAPAPSKRFFWGGTDNIVWQESAPLRLAAGSARLRLVAGPQGSANTPVRAARRHVDALIVTNDSAGVELQLRKARYLPLDGWLVQDGDLFVRFTNPKDAAGPVAPVVEGFLNGQHSPYAVHVREWPRTVVLRSGRLESPTGYSLDGPRSRAVPERLLAPLLDGPDPPPVSEYLAPGESSGWVPLGRVLDALNDSIWIPRVQYPPRTKPQRRELDLELEFAVPTARGELKPVRKLHVSGTPGYLSPVTFEIAGNVRDRPQLRTQLEALRWLRAQVEEFPDRRAPAERFPIFGLLGFSDAIGRPDALGEEATRLALALGDRTLDPGAGPWAARLGVPERRRRLAMHWPVEQVASKLGRAEKDGSAPRTLVVSYGDEIRVEPEAIQGDDALARFRSWLAGLGVAQAERATPSDDPRDPLFYHTRLFGYDAALARYAGATQLIGERLGQEVKTGINYSPHANFLVDELHFMRPFAGGALTLPWSEDYAWQVPEFSGQVTGYLVSGLRAGARRLGLKVLMYVMPHSPGNTPRDFRLSFYAAVTHGAQMIHLFCASPMAVANTENYIATDDLPMWRAVHDVVRDAGVFEGYVVGAAPRPARVGLLVSVVDDIRSGDSNRTGGLPNQERKALYYALRHSQVLVDFVGEADLLDGEARRFDLIYVTQEHLSTRATAALAAFVEHGGTLVALCHAGFKDEFGRRNAAAYSLFGVGAEALHSDPALPMLLAKQDLPGARPMGEAHYAALAWPALARRRDLVPDGARVIGTWGDGNAAVIEKHRGKGRAVMFGFFPGLAYLASGLPSRPVDRSSRDEGFNHFLPTAMDARLRRAIVDALLPAAFERPVEASEALVESGLLELPGSRRLAVPLLNYSGRKVTGLTLRLRHPGQVAGAERATGEPLEFHDAGGVLEARLDLETADMLLVELR